MMVPASHPDVVFDHAAAARAAASARGAAQRTDVAIDGLVRGAAMATADWQGLGRDGYDTEVQQAAAALDDVVTQLRQLAARIELAAAEATVEQRRREAARDAHQQAMQLRVEAS